MREKLRNLRSKVVVRIQQDGPVAALRHYFGRTKQLAHQMIYDRRLDQLERRPSGTRYLVRPEELAQPNRVQAKVLLQLQDIFMCFSAEASFTAAAVLVPAGALSLARAYKADRRYLPIAALPLLFGLQQTLEGAVWTANGNAILVEQFSLAYMFFSWLAWPTWVPFSAYFLESDRRKPLYLILAIVGGMLGAMQYFPYFAHDGWLTTRFLPHVIIYQGKELFDYIIGRHTTYTIYVAVVVGSLLLSRNTHVRIFGLLVAAVLIVTYLFFSYAYISVFCFGGAIMSLYLVWMIFEGGWRVANVERRL